MYDSPVGTPSDVAGCQILVTCSLLDKDVHLLLVVALEVDLLLSVLVVLILLALDGVVELKTSELVLNALYDFLSDQVELITSNVFFIFFHHQPEFIVFNSA